MCANKVHAGGKFEGREEGQGDIAQEGNVTAEEGREVLVEARMKV